MRYFVHCDNSFRKQNFIRSKLEFLDLDINEEKPDDINVVTFLYGYTYSKINGALLNMNIRLQRKNPSEINNCLSFTDCVILFHNFLEYNNGMQSIIDACLENKIPIVIYSEHIKKGFLSNTTGELSITKEFPLIKKLNNSITLEQFNYIPYKFIPSMSFKEVVNLTRENYKEIDAYRVERAIKLL